MTVNHTSTHTGVFGGLVLAAPALLVSNASIAKAETSIAAVARIIGIQWISRMEEGTRTPTPKHFRQGQQCLSPVAGSRQQVAGSR